MIEKIMDNLICLIVPIGIIIVLFQLRNQKPSPPSLEEKSVDYQKKEIDGMVGMWSDLKGRFAEAITEGATHVAYFKNEDVIKFYRTRRDEYEVRNLVFIPAPRWDWGSDWIKCGEIPVYAIGVSGKF